MMRLDCLRFVEYCRTAVRIVCASRTASSLIGGLNFRQQKSRFSGKICVVFEITGCCGCIKGRLACCNPRRFAHARFGCRNKGFACERRFEPARCFGIASYSSRPPFAFLFCSTQPTTLFKESASTVVVVGCAPIRLAGVRRSGCCSVEIARMATCTTLCWLWCGEK